MNRYNPDQFFKWLSEPMKPEDVEIWFLANNILPELTNLFEDFCLSLFYLMEDTYLGDYGDESRHTRIGMTKKIIWNTSSGVGQKQ